MPRRCSARLIAKELNAKRPKLSPSPVVQDGPLFDPRLQDILHRIVNELDPRSFVRFTRTCRELHEFCFNTKRIEIQFWDERVNFRALGLDEYPTRSYNVVVEPNARSVKKKALIMLNEEKWIALPDNYMKCLYTRNFKPIESFLSSISRIPTVFIVQKVQIDVEVVDEQFLMELRDYFEKFKSCFLKVELIELNFKSSIQDWNALLQFVQDFNVIDLSIGGEKTHKIIPPEISSFLAKNLNSLKVDFEISDDVILNASAEILKLPKARISSETFKELIKKVINGFEITEWLIGRTRRTLGRIDPFIEIIQEVGTIEVATNDTQVIRPGTLYSNFYRPTMFRFLTVDGAVGNFIINQDTILLRIW